MITIITPAYNAEKTIHKLYKNLKSLISKEIKWIIVNDKSQDNTAVKIKEIADENINVTFFNLEENKGPQYARYYGITKSETELVYLLDADDLIYEENFKHFFDFIQRNKNYDFYFSVITSITDESFYISNPTFKENKIVKIEKPTDFIINSLPHPSSLVIKKTFYLNVFNNCDLTWGEDIYMYLLLSQHGNGIRWSKPVSCYINNGKGRGSKLSFISRYKLSIVLFEQTFKNKNKQKNAFLFSTYMSFRNLASYIYKKIKK